MSSEEQEAANKDHSSNDSRKYSLEGLGLKLDTMKDVEPYVTELANKNQVEEIVLSGNTFGVQASEAIAAAIASKLTLKELNLSDIFTGRLREEIPDCMQALCNALLNKSHLAKLNLSDNAFGAAGIRPILGFLRQQRTLQALYFNNNGLGPEGGSLLAEALISSSQGVSGTKMDGGSGEFRLHTLIVGRNRLENASTPKFAELFRLQADNILEIRLPQNGIKAAGITSLCKGLKHCRNLRILDLQDNTFTKKGALAFSQILPNLTKLQTLNLGDCLLSDRGARAIIEVWLSSLGTAEGEDRSTVWELEELILESNEVSADTVSLLAKAIRRMPKLRRLELNGNVFAEDSPAAELVRDALRALGRPEALGSLSEMEEETSESEEEEINVLVSESEEEKEAKGGGEAEKQIGSLASQLENALCVGDVSSTAKSSV